MTYVILMSLDLKQDFHDLSRLLSSFIIFKIIERLKAGIWLLVPIGTTKNCFEKVHHSSYRAMF